MLIILACLSISSAPEPAENIPRHVMVYYEPGRFGGWPANHGIWAWGNEILVGFSRGYYKDLGPDRHHIDREKPEEHCLARSLDGGETWTVEHPNKKGYLLPQGREGLHGTELPGIPVPEPKPCPGGVNFAHPDFCMTFRMSSVDAGPARFYYSYDRGHSWEGPFAFPNFGALGVAARTDYLVEGPHTCLVFLTAAKSNGREGRPFSARTTNGAGSWEFLSWIAPETEGFAIMPATVRTAENELVTVVRRRESYNRWMNAYASPDNGLTWQPLPDPVDTLGEGNPPCLIRLRDGRLCLTYGHRAAPFRICAKLSADAGRTWSAPVSLREDGANRDIGYCRSVQRPDGKVVTVYYFNDLATGPERYIAATIWDPDQIFGSND